MDPTQQMAAILRSDLASIDHLVQYLPSAADREKLQDLLPVMMQTLPKSLNHGQKATAQEALELLIKLAGTESRLLCHQLPDVIGVMLQIAEADSPEVGTRHLALEFVITLAEARECTPGMMRWIPHFVGRLFAILMKVLPDVEDVLAWHSVEMEDEDAGESSNFSVGKECLNRFLIALGGNTFVPVASELLPAYLAAPEWQEYHAALITLAQIAEGCSKYGKQMVQKGTATALASVADSSQEQFQKYYNAAPKDAYQTAAPTVGISFSASAAVAIGTAAKRTSSYQAEAHYRTTPDPHRITSITIRLQTGYKLPVPYYPNSTRDFEFCNERTYYPVKLKGIEISPLPIKRGLPYWVRFVGSRQALKEVEKLTRVKKMMEESARPF